MVHIIAGPSKPYLLRTYSFFSVNEVYTLMVHTFMYVCLISYCLCASSAVSDADGDIVRCRWAESALSECDGCVPGVSSYTGPGWFTMHMIATVKSDTCKRSHIIPLTMHIGVSLAVLTHVWLWIVIHTHSLHTTSLHHRPGMPDCRFLHVPS